MRTPEKTFSLRNGVEIPALGYGTWKMPEGPEGVQAVKTALELGYRHIDTAACYGNETSVGRGIRAAEIPREDLFVTSKVWNTDRGYDKTLAAFDQTMEKLGLDVLDLYLIHWPAAAHQDKDWEITNRETWRAMTRLYREGRVRSIGVSNFLPHHLRGLLETEEIPMVNQIEFHPGWMQPEVVSFCRTHGILIEAWSPMARGRLQNHPLLKQLGEKYGKTPAQLCLRWCLDNGTLPLPKSVTPSRMRENLDLFDFALAPEDLEAMNRMETAGYSGLDPDRIDF